MAEIQQAPDGSIVRVDEPPNPGDLPRATSESSLVLDPGLPALDKQGRLLASPAAQLSPGSALLAAETGGFTWAIYRQDGLDAVEPPHTLSLDLSAQSGLVWVGLPNYFTGSWTWKELGEADPKDIDLINTGAVNEDGSLFFTVAVYDGATVTFNGADYGVDGIPAVDPPVEPDPVADADKPAVVGAYISHGYWNTAEVEDLMAELASTGVNLVFDYALILPEAGNEREERELERYFDAAQTNGIKVAWWLGHDLKGMTPEDAPQRIEALRATVQRFRDEPALGGWYVHDEVLPSLSGVDGTGRYCITLEQMKALYDMVKAEDPHHPQMSVWCYLGRHEQFMNYYGREEHTPYGRPAWMDNAQAFEAAMTTMMRNTTDVVLIDTYPVDSPWHEGEDPADVVGRLAARAAELKNDAQPMYLVFQSFSWAQYREESAGSAFPTVTEMESMVAAAHAEGATGAITYSWFDLTEDIEGRNIPGRDAALDNLKGVLGNLAQAWPAGDRATSGLLAKR